jgi:hypothetical protein
MLQGCPAEQQMPPKVQVPCLSWEFQCPPESLPNFWTVHAPRLLAPLIAAARHLLVSRAQLPM